MDQTNFCYWLQGYSELCGDAPNKEQWDIIKEHLQLVFTKQTQLPPFERKLYGPPESPWPKFDLKDLVVTC